MDQKIPQQDSRIKGRVYSQALRPWMFSIKPWIFYCSSLVFFCSAGSAQTFFSGQLSDPDKVLASSSSSSSGAFWPCPSLCGTLHPLSTPDRGWSTSLGDTAGVHKKTTTTTWCQTHVFRKLVNSALSEPGPPQGYDSSLNNPILSATLTTTHHNKRSGEETQDFETGNHSLFPVSK